MSAGAADPKRKTGMAGNRRRPWISRGSPFVEPIDFAEFFLQQGIRSQLGGPDESRFPRQAPRGVPPSVPLREGLLNSCKEDAMFYIDHVDRENADGIMKVIYDIFPKQIPGPLLVKSISPELAETTLQSLKIGALGKIIPSAVSAAIRFVMAVRMHADYCIKFNGDGLSTIGFTQEDLDKLGKDVACGKFSDRENALIKFAIESVQAPATVDEKAFNAIKELGWTDQEILAATSDAADALSGLTLFQVFKRKES